MRTLAKSGISVTTTFALTLGLAMTANASTTSQEKAPNPAHTISARIRTIAPESPYAPYIDPDKLLTQLEQLPEDIKQADPRTTPNYRETLNRYINVRDILTTPLLTPYFDLPKCLFEVGSVILQYGIPVAKIIGWIKEARAIFGAGKGLITAIRYGYDIGTIGASGVEVLKGLLGIDGLVQACFM